MVTSPPPQPSAFVAFAERCHSNFSVLCMLATYDQGNHNSSISRFSSLTWEKLHAFPLLQPWSVRKKRHFGFLSFPSSLFVGDLPVSSSPFFAFDFSASKDFSFGCSPLAAAEDVPGFFSVRASCSNSARRWYANCSTFTSFGVVSTPSPDRTRETLNCSSRLLSNCFFDILRSPFSCRAGSGGTAPISFARFLASVLSAHP